MIGFRGRVAVVLGLIALPALIATPAAASWQVGTVDDGPVASILLDVSCPSPSLCVAVGSNSTVAVSTDPTGAAWSTVHPEGYFSPPAGVGSGSKYAGNQITGVSCPAPSLCVASGPQGNIIASTDPTGGAAAWSITELGLQATHMNAISCPTAGLCVAVANVGKIVTSTDPTGGPSAWSIARIETPLDLRGVSCATPSLCVAVANTGEVLASTDPTGGAAAWRVLGRPAGEDSMNGVDCPSVGLCAAANAGRIVTSTDPAGGLGQWQAVSAGSGFPVESLSCPSTEACAAIDNNGDAIVSTDPTGGAAAWSFTNVIPATQDGFFESNGLFGVSCPTTALCVAVGNEDQVIFSTDPFAVEPIFSGAERATGGRPRVAITWHPGQRVDRRAGGARVGFRFRGFGRIARFQCRLTNGHRHGYSHCRSPVHYRVGRGKHVFRVVAISPEGRRSRPATFRFRVGPVTEPGPYGSCPLSEMPPLGRPCQTPR